MITLDAEVSLIWNSDWSIAKAAFFTNRYLPIVDFVLVYLCELKPTLPCLIYDMFLTWLSIANVLGERGTDVSSCKSWFTAVGCTSTRKH